MRRSRWLIAIMSAGVLISGWACAPALSEDEKPGDKPAARDQDDRPRPPRPDGEREGPPPRRDGDFNGPGPRRDGEPPKGGPREGGPRDGGPRREGDRPDGPPPQRPDGPPPRRDGEGGGRPPFGPGGGPGYGPPREGDLERMKEHDPEMYELLKQDNEFDHDSRTLAEKIRKLATGAEDRKKFEAELKELIQKHFDVRQKRREIELKRVEEQLSRLRESIKTRLEGREESIRRRLAELIGRPEDLGF